MNKRSRKEQKVSYLKRPLLSAAVTQLIAAVISTYCYREKLHWSAVPVIVLVGILAFEVLRICVRFNKNSCLYYLIFLIFPVTIIRTGIVSDRLGKCYENITFTGTIYNMQNKDGYNVLYINNTDIHTGIIVYTDDNKCNAGDIVRVTGDVKEFDKPRNYGSFDANMYYISLGYPYKCNADKVVVTESNNNRLRYILYVIKQKIKGIYAKVYKDKAGLMSSIVLGDKYELDIKTKEEYQKNGIAHLLAISGLHISLVGMAVYKLIRKYIGIMKASVISIAVIIMYLIMTGETVSAKRAVCMLVLIIIADVYGRTFDILTGLSAASILILGRNPYTVYSMSYIMSFLAIIGISQLYPVLMPDEKAINSRMDNTGKIVKKLIVYIINALLCSIVVTIATLPAVLYSYNSVFLTSIFINCIVIPLMPVVMITGIITAFAGFISLKLAYFTAGAGNYVLDFYDFVCERNSRLGQFRIITGQPPAGVIIVYSVLMIIFIIINKPSFKYNFKNYCKMHSLVNKAINCIIAVMLVVLVLNMRYKPYNGLQINMLDVGQGDSIYVSASGRYNFLFDGGSTDIKSAGQYRVYPALRAMGCKYIDCIFISHTDNDHISAVMELIKMCDDTFSIGSIVMPDIKGKENIEAYMKLVDMAYKAGINVCYAVRGYTFTVGELDIKCIHPCAGYDYEDSNDYSAVYCISYKKFSMLMTGDAESRAEDCLINDINKERAANVDIKDELSDITVLKVGHHGSKYATSDKLLKTIKPQYALISCGINNRYGHPHSETLERLEDNNCKVYVTNTLGEIIIRTDGYKMSVHQYLQ